MHRLEPGRALAFLATLALALAGAGCGDDDSDGAEGDITPQATQPQADDEDVDSAAQIDPAEGEPAAGQEVFAEYCASCHGEDGGGGGTGPSLQDEDLADDPRQVVSQIVNGGGGMPPFGGRLTDEQIADVAAFVIEDLAQR